MHIQAKLMRMLTEHKMHKVGSIQSIPINVRIIASSSKNLHHLMEKKLFREDLYYRLNVIPIHTQPLASEKKILKSMFCILLINIVNYMRRILIV